MTHAPESHRLDAAAIQRDLRPKRIGRTVVVLPEVDSTNSYVLDRLAGDARNDGAVVFAEHQTAGRGRLGRPWHSPSGGSLIFTVLLFESADRAAPARWMMASAVATAQAVAQETDLTPQVRWPNDLYLGRRKLAGILVETRRTAVDRLAVAIGIGINCLQHRGHFPPDLRESAVSLEMESSHPIDRTAIARTVLRRLDQLLTRQGVAADSELAAQWRDLSADIGARARLISDGQEFSGQIIDIHPISGLLLQLDTGGRRQFDPQTTTRL